MATIVTESGPDHQNMEIEKRRTRSRSVPFKIISTERLELIRRANVQIPHPILQGDRARMFGVDALSVYQDRDSVVFVVEEGPFQQDGISVASRQYVVSNGVLAKYLSTPRTAPEFEAFMKKYADESEVDRLKGASTTTGTTTRQTGLKPKTAPDVVKALSVQHVEGTEIRPTSPIVCGVPFGTQLVRLGVSQLRIPTTDATTKQSREFQQFLACDPNRHELIVHNGCDEDVIRSALNIQYLRGREDRSDRSPIVGNAPIVRGKK
jgi:hypothetical protein